MTGIDLKELEKKNPKIARARAIVAAVNGGAKAMRDFRKKSGLSQAQMAAKLGVTQPRIAQLESGKPGNAPSLEQLADAALLAGGELLVCDRSEIGELAEEQPLLDKARSLEARAREGQVHTGHQQPPASDPQFVLLPISDAEFARLTRGAAKKSFEGSAFRITDRTARFWVRPVPRQTLKRLARSLETSANDTKKTKAYDVLTRVSKAIGTTVAAGASTEKPRRGRREDR